MHGYQTLKHFLHVSIASLLFHSPPVFCVLTSAGFIVVGGDAVRGRQDEGKRGETE